MASWSVKVDRVSVRFCLSWLGKAACENPHVIRMRSLDTTGLRHLQKDVVLIISLLPGLMFTTVYLEPKRNHVLQVPCDVVGGIRVG
jgi:hypothetical protein